MGRVDRGSFAWFGSSCPFRIPSIGRLTAKDMFTKPHRRFNPLVCEWVLVSPHRTERPWLGQEDPASSISLPAYDPDCYLCPGNARAEGARNPVYDGVFVFDNDFPALLEGTPLADHDQGGLLIARSERGSCRVVCFSPRHDLTLPELGVDIIVHIMDSFRGQFVELGESPSINYVQIFENKGAMMGASNPHPHAQIWATESIPTEPAKELAACRTYMSEHGSCLLCDYLTLEIQESQRIVCANEAFVAVVPFWAVWPFEVMLLSRRHVNALTELNPQQTLALADILKRLTARFDNLFQTSFPYSMGFHQRPTDGSAYPELHFHAHFFPPLLRSASVRKFMVGYEMLAEPQRDITPESAAERLRQASEIHYKTPQG
jgi:UDPglucose--hexose-1-phosphate uridylyltransferase